MSGQSMDLEQPQSAEVAAQTSAEPQNKWRDLFWTLPQPILIFGSMFAVATAFVYEWTDPALYALIMILLPLPLILIAERIWVKRTDWILTPKEFAEDAFWLAASALIWVPVYFDMSLLNFTLAPTSVLGLVLAAILVRTLSEFIYYWLHRVQHESLFWWRMHAMHHHMTKLSAARGDRTHPLEFATLMIGTPIALALTGASDGVIAVTGAFGFFNAVLNHSNLPLRSGIYGWYFCTAAMHHLHHSRDLDSSNSNYGCAIIIWDRIFGTFSGRTDIEALGAGTGKPLSILTQFKMAFVSKEQLIKY
jgi:sterol desaturase/sphingolipid hydroxylase (fatty acid hydroxylase superfamily)